MINITIKNTDLQDLFVTVVDLNQAVRGLILDAKRINKGQSMGIEVQDDGDGRGHIRWQVNETESPLTGKSGEAARLSDGDTVEVST
jgi:hypothetical protein